MKITSQLRSLYSKHQNRQASQLPLPSHLGQMAAELIAGRNKIRGMANGAEKAFLQFCLKHNHLSYSQFHQDLFALYVLGQDKGGYFADIGAANGIAGSNSYMLEKSFGWTGVCAEPGRSWRREFTANRPQTKLETRCVWGCDDAQLVFAETPARGFSTLKEFRSSDPHKKIRRRAKEYPVKTVSLNTLLIRNKCPAQFEYLSMDTEGSEFEILKHLDFDQFRPKVITIEHNFTDARERIFELLMAQGYRRVLTELSYVDDWYILNDLADHIA